LWGRSHTRVVYIKGQDCAKLTWGTVTKSPARLESSCLEWEKSFKGGGN
jgi:hypothetical protein